MCVYVWVVHLCPILWNSTNFSLPGSSSVHGILQAKWNLFFFFFYILVIYCKLVAGMRFLSGIIMKLRNASFFGDHPVAFVVLFLFFLYLIVAKVETQRGAVTCSRLQSSEASASQDSGFPAECLLLAEGPPAACSFLLEALFLELFPRILTNMLKLINPILISKMKMYFSFGNQF